MGKLRNNKKRTMEKCQSNRSPGRMNSKWKPSKNKSFARKVSWEMPYLGSYTLGLISSMTNLKWLLLRIPW
jgi:hypothetical protein